MEVLTVKFFLSHMVSKGCIQLVELKLSSIPSIKIISVRLGEVVLEMDKKSGAQIDIEGLFESLGFKVLKHPDTLITEQAKLAAIELIYYANNSNSLIRNSDYISDKLQMPYEKISKIFSRVTGNTLEKYIIQLKVEKAKELIAGNEYSLSEISYMLGYSSVQYLSNQFKKTAGITVSEFKENPIKYRLPIEDF